MFSRYYQNSLNKIPRSGQHQQEARSTVSGAKRVLELQTEKEKFRKQQDGNRKQSISTCEIRTERKYSVASGNGDRRRGKREESWKTVPKTEA